MQYVYNPKNVCPREMKIEVDGNIIKKVEIVGGCAGNTVGISRLIQGMDINEAIRRLTGIPCGNKGTSCPDQLAEALKGLKEKMEKMKK